MSGSQDYCVIVVTHDHDETIGACLEAVGQMRPAPTRVVVIDNASRDQSREVIEGFPVELIRESSNTGFAAAVNRGLALTDEEWVFVLNPDCAPEPGFVDELFKAEADADVPIGALCGLLLRASDSDLNPTTTVDSAGMIMTRSGRHFDRGAGSATEKIFEERAWVFGSTGAAALFRREALRDVAYPDGQIFAESFFAYREDAELAWRLQLRDWRCLYVGSARASHRRGFQPEQGRKGHKLINYHSVKNRFLLRWHCADVAWHILSFPWWILRDLLVLGACVTVEFSSLGALGQLIRLSADAHQRRQWNLGRRIVGARQIQPWFRKQGHVRQWAKS